VAREISNLKEILKSRNIKLDTITYHDACHAKRVQNIEKEPRELLAQNYNIVEMSDSSRFVDLVGLPFRQKSLSLQRELEFQKLKMIEGRQKAKIFVSAEL